MVEGGRPDFLARLRPHISQSLFMKGFISYCHQDHAAMVRLKTHLSAIERGFGLAFWWDERIAPGNYWRDEIAAAIDEADVVILGVTPDFIASNYIYDVELPALRRRVRAGALLVPVVLKKCSWDFVAGAVQAVPTIGAVLKPVDEWRDEDGYDRARVQMRDRIEKHFGVKAKAFRW